LNAEIFSSEARKKPVKILRELDMDKSLSQLNGVRPSDSQRYIALPFAQMRFAVDENK